MNRHTIFRYPMDWSLRQLYSVVWSFHFNRSV